MQSNIKNDAVFTIECEDIVLREYFDTDLEACHA